MSGSDARVLQGKVAIVTGSTGGLGRATAELFAREGAKVVISGRRRSLGEEVAVQIEAAGGEAHVVAGDLRDPAYCAALSDEAVARWGRLDILVNNAGVSWRGNLETTDVKLWDEIMALNVRAPFLCCQAAVPQMRASGGGAIVNVGSTNAYIGGRDLLPYSTSKGGLMTFSKNLAGALQAEGIRVNLLNVGWILTDGEDALQRSLGAGDNWAEVAAQQMPLGRLLRPEEVARHILFLASDQSAPITGSVLVAQQHPVE